MADGPHQAKIDRALELLEGSSAAAQLAPYYSSGRIFKAGGLVTPSLPLPGWEEGIRFSVASCPPSWEVLTEDLFDDAVVGEGGDWEHSANFVPVLAMANGVLVVSVGDPQLPVGFFDEESWSDDGEGYTQGVFGLWPSLDACLSALGVAEDGDDVMELTVEDLWQDVA